MADMSKSYSSTLTDYTKVVSQSRSHTIQDQQHGRKLRKVRRKPVQEDTVDLLAIPGVQKITLSANTQKVVSCVVDEDVTSESAWTRITKETLEYDMDARGKACEFKVFKKQIKKYEGEDFLIGYIPDETKDYDEYYICLTKAAEVKVSEIIKSQKEADEERLRNSVVKSVRPWRTCGSEKDIIDIRPNRMTLQVELDGEYPPLGNQQYQLRMNTAKSITNTYADLLPLRLSFTNVLKKRIEFAAQVKPFVTSISTQSTYRYPKHTTTQYEYKCKHIEQPEKNVINSFREFMENNMDELDDYLTIGSNINLYSDDYGEMSQGEIIKSPDKMTVKEYLSLSNLTHPKGIGVSGVVFHPTWSSTLAIMYSFLPPSLYKGRDSHKDLVDVATFQVLPVLIWSLVDILNPSLILETPSQVTCLAFCPHDENLLVGGCASGQIIVWDLTNKLTKAESQEILSSDQQKYRILMQSLTPWIKNTNNVRVVRETITSNLNYSHTASVSSISWLNPFHEFNTCGRITVIPEEQNRTSRQFVSCGKEGNILIWDLNTKPNYSVEDHKPPRKSRRIKIRPEALTVDVSTYRELHRVMIPKFQITVAQPGTSRALPLSVVKFQKFPFEYVAQHSNQNQPYSFFKRVMFKTVLVHPKALPKHEFLTGTLEGDFISVAWNGFSVPPGQRVPKEMCKIQCISKYHDGPIVTLAKHLKFQDLILTVGGKVFALWNLDFMQKPVIWRRSTQKYTHGRFYTMLPSRVCLVRQDGYMEVWDFVTRSQTSRVAGLLSAHPLICSVAHPRKLTQNYFVTGDSRGACRVILIPRSVALSTDMQQRGTYDICLRERKRKEDFLQWQDKWCRHHKKETQLKKEQIRRREEKQEEDTKTKKIGYHSKQEEQGPNTVPETSTLEPPQPGKFTEWAHKKYMLNEKIRNNKLLLKNKSLDIEVLEKQREPVVELERQAQKNAYRLQHYSRRAQAQFNASAGHFFPDTVAENLPSLTDALAFGDTVENKIGIYKTYEEIKDQNDIYVKDHPLKHTFNWQKMLSAGKERRKFLDGYYARYNHDDRFKMLQKAKRASNPSQMIVPKISDDDSLTDDVESLI